MRHAAPSPTRSPIRSVFALGLAVLAFGGCSALEHGYRTGEIAGQTLPLTSTAARERLEMETSYDASVGRVVAEHGQPELLHVADRNHLYLFYPAEDRVVSVVRAGRPPGDVKENQPIPGHYFRLLPKAQVARIKQARAAREAAKPRVRRAPRRAVAAVDPDAGAVQITGFDVETLVARFRKPMSAADPGVSGWREITDANGARAGVARSGRTEYRVQRDVVVASTAVSRSSRRAPADANNGMVRVNRAVFGTRASEVSRSLAPLLQRVAADPSGRTRFERRVAGRSVRIARDLQQSRILYAVSAN